jgi:hypothetical protein
LARNLGDGIGRGSLAELAQVPKEGDRPMTESNGSSLTYQTKCRMKKADGTPCNFTLVDHALNVAIVGQPDARIQKFIGELMKHSAKKHPEGFQLAQMLQMFFFGWLIMGQFESPDPALQQTMKKFENDLRRKVTPEPVTDNEIESALAAMELTMDDPHREPFKHALEHLRDYYEGKIPQQTLDSVKPLIVTP